MMKKVAVLGSTGSIGLNTLEVIRKLRDRFEISAITADTSIDLLEKQANEFSPEFIVVRNKGNAKELRRRIGNKIQVLEGEEGLVEFTKSTDYDILVSSLVGFAGLVPTIEGIKRGKRIALANKETLVAAGEIVTQLAKKHGAEIIPVDSEHSAIFQCLVGEKSNTIQKLIITASGGPFFKKPVEELKKVTVEEALNHPNWDMGNKVTIDSATMMNKGLEVIEAHWLFELNKEKLDVVVHPQSIVHSMVEFIDGSIKAQLSLPDMKIPIQYALTYPERMYSNFVNTNFPELHTLSFYEPDFEKFKCLGLAFEAMEQGGLAPCILNAANEIAVEKFLKKELTFLQIPELIEKTLNKIPNTFEINLENVMEYDKKAREVAKNLI